MSAIFDLIGLSIIIASLSAFFILFIGKIGLREKIILYAPELLSKLYSCDFCLSFWISVIFAIFVALIHQDPTMLIIPAISTPITRILI